MRCRVCGKSNQREGAECRYCGAVVRSVLGKGKPLPPAVNDELYLTRKSNRASQSRRRRKRLVWHTVAGAIVLFGVAVWVNFATLVYIPRTMLLGILKSVPVALVLGPPIGFITSWRNYGPLGGATVGAMFFALGTFLFTGGSPVWLVVVGTLLGIVVGGLMGVHVMLDSD